MSVQGMLAGSSTNTQVYRTVLVQCRYEMLQKVAHVLASMLHHAVCALNVTTVLGSPLNSCHVTLL